MSVVPYSNPIATDTSSAFDLAPRDDFFGFGNAMQAIDSITPKHTNPDGSIGQPVQVVTTVSSGAIPPDLALSGGPFFDLRSPSEIFAEMDARLVRQRQHVLNSPKMMKMIEQQQ